jgi:hypothetical protein
MRQGLLFALQGSMSGVGDVGKIGDGELALSLTRCRWPGSHKPLRRSLGEGAAGRSWNLIRAGTGG